MAKWSGLIGFSQDSEESSPSVYIESIKEVKYTGEIIKNTRKNASTDKVNTDISVSNIISIVADPYAMNHFFSIKYATFYGTKWTVTDVQVNYPRLLLTLGGIYNG